MSRRERCSANNCNCSETLKFSRWCIARRRAIRVNGRGGIERIQFRVTMAKKPHEIIAGIIDNALQIAGLKIDRKSSPGKVKSGSRSYREDITQPIVSVVARLKAQFDKHILKR